MRTVEDILMAKGSEVIVSAHTETVLDAARLMAEAHVGSLVIRQNHQVAGVFTEQDLLRRVVAAGKDPSATPLAQVMSSRRASRSSLPRISSMRVSMLLRRAS